MHEDGGLAYKLQSEEIEEHLNHNKIRSQIVRSDNQTAKSIQQTEQQIYQQYRKQRQAQIDEQLAKELQLNLIEEDQKQMMETQRIVEEDEKYAKCLAEKEKQRMAKRKLAREQAQIEKIKRDRLQYYLDNNFEISSTMNDDLDELDLSDFCMKPPDQLKGDQLQTFMADQDEELARFLQIYENQKKTTLIKDKQELMENQDFEIARLIYEEEKAKLRRIKEKRLQKQRAKAARNQVELNDCQQRQQQEYYLPDNRLYRLPNQLNERQLDEDQLNYANHEEASLYDEPPQEDNLPNSYSNQLNCDNSFENCSSEETNLKQLDDRSSNQKLDNKLEQNQAQQLHYNALNQIENNAQYTLSTKQFSNQNNSAVANFVNRALPPVPNTAKFDNIFSNIDPTYNKSKEKSNSISDNTLNSSSISSDSTNLQINGLHFARVVVVENDSNNQNEYDLVEQLAQKDHSADQLNQQFNNQINSQNYVIQNQQLNPVQGQKRASATLTSQKKSKDKKSKEKSSCRQQ